MSSGSASDKSDKFTTSHILRQLQTLAATVPFVSVNCKAFVVVKVSRGSCSAGCIYGSFCLIKSSVNEKRAVSRSTHTQRATALSPNKLQTRRPRLPSARWGVKFQTHPCNAPFVIGLHQQHTHPECAHLPWTRFSVCVKALWSVSCCCCARTQYQLHCVTRCSFWFAMASPECIRMSACIITTGKL